MASDLASGLPVKQLFEKDGPLVWVDCEMTGLDHNRDKLLEIAVVITNGDLERVDGGINLIIRQEKNVLDNMDPWCINQHGKVMSDTFTIPLTKMAQSGLTQACLESPHTAEDVTSQVLSYIKQRIPEQKVAHLAGNSVHQDRLFLLQEMPEVIDWLHYRIVDVSTIKVLTNRWCPQHAFKHDRDSNHRALDDILGSIKELQAYRQNIFLNGIVREAEAEAADETENGRGAKRKHI